MVKYLVSLIVPGDPGTQWFMEHGCAERIVLAMGGSWPCDRPLLLEGEGYFVSVAPVRLGTEFDLSDWILSNGPFPRPFV